MRGNKSSRLQLAEGHSRKYMMSKLVVLIVEDEPLLRMDAVDFIEEAGFEVIEAAHAEEAIAILKARRDIAVVFTDIEMPGSMDGMKLAHVVRLGWPPILIVVASGRVMPREGELPENVQSHTGQPKSSQPSGRRPDQSAMSASMGPRSEKTTPAG